MYTDNRDVIAEVILLGDGGGPWLFSGSSRSHISVAVHQVDLGLLAASRAY